jgi:hypothetical protein
MENYDTGLEILTWTGFQNQEDRLKVKKQMVSLLENWPNVHGASIFNNEEPLLFISV